MNLSTGYYSDIESLWFSNLRTFVEVVRQGGFFRVASVV